jgi:hypothetical protein
VILEAISSMFDLVSLDRLVCKSLLTSFHCLISSFCVCFDKLLDLLLLIKLVVLDTLLLDILALLLIILLDLLVKLVSVVPYFVFLRGILLSSTNCLLDKGSIIDGFL